MAQFNMESGLDCQLEAHTEGPTGQYTGGWATSLSINGTSVPANLMSKVKGATSPTPCASFLTFICVENGTLLTLRLALDAKGNDQTVPAGILNSLVGAEAQNVKFNGQIEAADTLPQHQVLSSVSIDGFIHELGGKLCVSPGSVSTLGGGTHKVQEFTVKVRVNAQTVLSCNFGGQLNKTFPIAPISK
jgi:hypothetical protein